MSILYEFYRNPESPESKKKRYHARVVPAGRISTDQLAEEIQKESSLTVADVKSVLIALADKLGEHLGEGRKVHLEGIGYFRLTLSAPSDITPTNMHRQRISIKAVDFRADTSLKKDLAENAQFKRTEHKHRSALLDVYEIDALLVDFFETNQYLTRRRFEQLCDFTPSTAARHLKRLLDEGRLKNTNTKQSPVYEPVKGYYGK